MTDISEGRTPGEEGAHAGDDGGSANVLRFGDDLIWVNECFPLGPDEHEHVSVYLLDGPDARVVMDSGSFYHRESIRQRLHAIVAEEGLDGLVLSHSDYPHSGNIGAFREEWGDIEIVASSAAPELQGLPYATRCRIGGTMDACGRRMSFIDPPLADRSHTTWIYDHQSGALFTADGFGNVHKPGECDWASSDFPDGIPTDAIRRFHAQALRWLRYVDPPKLEARIREIFESFDVTWVCPVHGNVIPGHDLDRYLDRLSESVRGISADYAKWAS